jgi:hypothetical protein
MIRNLRDDGRQVAARWMGREWAWVDDREGVREREGTPYRAARNG